MATDHWPDPDIDWNYPAETPENTQLWQSAINDGLTTHRLSIVPAGYKTFDLAGPCPRCGHATAHNFGVEEVREAGEGTREVVAKTNVDCRCTSKHPNAPEKRAGCGWGGPLITELSVTIRSDDGD